MTSSFSHNFSFGRRLDRFDVVAAERPLRFDRSGAVWRPDVGVPPSHGVDDVPSVFLPEHYEPNYAYPLVVWLTGGDGGGPELLALMPLISPRNHVGVAVRETSAALSRPSLAEFAVAEAVGRVAGAVNIHSERIYLAGFDMAATRALEFLLRRPDWFAGSILFGGRPRIPRPLPRYVDLPGRRVLMAVDPQDHSVSLGDVVAASRLLHLVGVDVEVRSYDIDDASDVTLRMLRDVDGWILRGIGTALASV